MDYIVLLAENDEEMAIFDFILNRKNRKYHYVSRSQGVFNLDNLEDDFCFVHFRFYKAEIRRLRVLLDIPDVILLKTRIKVGGDEAFCILLRRLAYPNRLVDLMRFFPRGRSALSEIFNYVVEHIIQTKSHILEDINQSWLSKDHVKLLCESLVRKGSPYMRCFGFLDGTVKGVCRPTYSQRQFYNGHKRQHAIKFQSLMLPNGIIANLFGPVNGRRHDGHILAKSGLLNKLERKFRIFRAPPHLYSDSGYPLRKYLITPFKGTPNRSEKIVNQKMSKLRVTVEWGFAKIVQLFPFVDFKKNLKVYKQEVGNYYKVCVILSNCHTCLYGSQVCDYFEMDPPELEEYLGN